MERPDFCTVVSPDEYDWFEQFENAVKEANNYHKKIHNDCPPPYYPVDMGKVWGLVIELKKYKDAEAKAT